MKHRHIRWQIKLMLAIFLLVAGYTELVNTQPDIVRAEIAYTEAME